MCSRYNGVEGLHTKVTEFEKDKECLVCGPGVLIELEPSVTLKKVLSHLVLYLKYYKVLAKLIDCQVYITALINRCFFKMWPTIGPVAFMSRHYASSFHILTNK